MKLVRLPCSWKPRSDTQTRNSMQRRRGRKNERRTRKAIRQASKKFLHKHKARIRNTPGVTFFKQNFQTVIVVEFQIMADKMHRSAEMERLLAEGTANELAATRWLNSTVLMRDVGMAERSQMTSNEFALWWRCKTKWFHMTRLLSRRRRAAPVEPEPASYPEDALTPQTVSIMSACASEGKSRPACKRKLFPDVPTHLVKQDELEVKSSGQRCVQFVNAGRETGLGLFMPANIGAPCKTVDLTFQGPGVMRVQNNSVEE